VRTLALALDVPLSGIQFTPDLMPADITASRCSPGLSNSRSAGPVFRPLLADESTARRRKTQAALLEAMQERTVTVDGQSHPLSKAVHGVSATQNPIEVRGHLPLAEAELDRFMAKVQIGYPSAEVGAGDSDEVRRRLRG